MAIESNVNTPPAETASSRRLKYSLSVGILLVSLLVILGVLNWIANDTATRVDLTARGRYSISQQTRNLLNSLQDPVTITLLFSERDPTLNSDQQRLLSAQRSQIEDVLRELRSKTDKIEVVHIDPTDPTVARYDDLIARLKEIYKDESQTYIDVVAQGRAVLDELAAFCAAQSESLISASGDLPPDHPAFRNVQTIIQIFAGVPREMESVGKSIDESMKDAPMMGQPFPDLQGAVSIVRAACQLRGNSLRQFADYFQSLVDSNALPEALAAKLREPIQQYRDMAGKLADEVERIGDLEPLQLSSINSALRQRNCVLLSNNTKATVLPYNRLFPPPGADQAIAEEGTGVLRRFAGETVIASGIRQLTLTDRPVVVLCHAEQAPSILIGQPGRVDLSSVADQLRDTGFEVREWNVNSGPRPVIDQKVGQPVWVIVPPMPSGQMAMAGGQLADAATSLVAEGANVMINFFPSFIPSIGQADPWNTAIKPLGVSADSSRIIVQRIPGPNGQDQFAATHDLVDYKSDNPIATAVEGEPTELDLAVPLTVQSAAPPADAATPEDQKATSGADAPKQPAAPNTRHTVLLEIEPSDRVWATPIASLQTGQPEPPDQPDTEPYAEVVAVERNGDFGLQRALVVGSARWCWTGTVGLYDFSTQLPMYPGNAELFCSGVCWLAHLDDLIARSPRAESVARIENLGSGAQIFWRWALIGGLPLLSLAAGIVVTISRRG